MSRSVTVGAAVLALLAAATTAGGASGARPFSAYASCGIEGKHGDRFCFEGDRTVAVYRAFGRAGVAYTVCARKRGGRRRCAERRTNNPGQRSRTRVRPHGPGRYELAWFEQGAAVDRDELVVRARRALIVGDSLSDGTKPYLPGALARWRVEQRVATSRHAPQGVEILRRRQALPGAVIFALGTNDDPRAVGAFRDSLEAALAIAGEARCLVVPNIVRPPAGGVSYAAYNREIATLARRHDNFRVVDWAALVRRNRAWLADDGAHVTAEGYEARARAIAHQVERC
jgi:lysophospholipase L1-like esterase